MIAFCSLTISISSVATCPLARDFLLYDRINFQIVVVGVLKLKLEHKSLHPRLFSLLSTLLQRAVSRRNSVQLSSVGEALYIRQRLRRTFTASEHFLFHHGAGVGQLLKLFFLGSRSFLGTIISMIFASKVTKTLYLETGSIVDCGERSLLKPGGLSVQQTMKSHQLLFI